MRLTGMLAVTVLLSLSAAPALATSCRQAVGETRAKELVQQCQEVSPATHPPCNAGNECSLIIHEIRRSCALLRGDAPAFCREYR